MCQIIKKIACPREKNISFPPSPGPPSRREAGNSRSPAAQNEDMHPQETAAHAASEQKGDAVTTHAFSNNYVSNTFNWRRPSPFGSILYHYRAATASVEAGTAGEGPSNAHPNPHSPPSRPARDAASRAQDALLFSSQTHQ